VKNAWLTIPLLAAGALAAAGCASSSSSTAAAPPATASSSGATSSAATSSGAAGPTASSTGSAAPSASAATAACTSADLKATLGGGPGAGMSQNHTGLELRNVGSTACTLHGYPGVSWVAGADGHQVGAAAVRQANSDGGTEKTVTVAPGALASAPLDIVSAAVFSQSECKPVPVRGLRVYPPGEKAALFVALPTASGGYGECSVATKSPALSIGYLEAGAQPN
jgi:hypothetical protein